MWGLVVCGRVCSIRMPLVCVYTCTCVCMPLTHHNNNSQHHHANGNFHHQVMTYEQAEKFRWNPFDLTKIWPHKVSKEASKQAGGHWFCETHECACVGLVVPSSPTPHPLTPLTPIHLSLPLTCIHHP